MMETTVYVLNNRRLPWGDYGDILLSGMTSHLGRDHGMLQLERTGPFVPPIAITGIDARGYSQIMVTDAHKSLLEATNLTGLRFLPVIKKHIVHLEWQRWDRTAGEPLEYPESGEPEDYILARRHDQALADQMGALWELCLEEHARTKRMHVGPGRWDEAIWLIRDSWDGTDWFRATGVGYVYVSEKAKRWLEQTVPEWVTLDPASLR